MSPYGLDAFLPSEIAQKVEQVGVAKARLPWLTMCLLGILAGAFIGLGAFYFVLVVSDETLHFAVARVLGGVVFSMGLLLVIVAGAELFTGNNLLAMAWVDRKITTRQLLRNWVWVSVANFVGAVGIALIIFLSGAWQLNDGKIAQTIIKIAAAKCNASAQTLFWKGVLCNMLVCLAVWMAMAGRTVTDKFFAIVLPISAFVAAGFEHSIANMFFIPFAILLKTSGAIMDVASGDAITVLAMLRNLWWVILGNLLGGSVLVALVYHVIYRRDPLQQ